MRKFVSVYCESIFCIHFELFQEVEMNHIITQTQGLSILIGNNSFAQKYIQLSQIK